jgi:lipid A 4'-phosphatase
MGLLFTTGREFATPSAETSRCDLKEWGLADTLETNASGSGATLQELSAGKHAPCSAQRTWPASRSQVLLPRMRWQSASPCHERLLDSADHTTTQAQTWPVWRPLLGLLLLTLVFRWTNLDVVIAAVCFDSQSGTWRWATWLPFQAMYSVGACPAFLLAGLGGISWLAGSRGKGWPLSRNAGRFLVVLFLIGPGLVVNAGFKQTWGRPRPSQVRQFGGKRAFVPVGTPSPGQIHNSSFPSGHAAAAFYLMAPAFAVRGRRPGLAAGLLTSGGLFGLLMGLARIAQGGHWASDILWSAAIIYFLAIVLARVLLPPPRTTTPEPAIL